MVILVLVPVPLPCRVRNMYSIPYNGPLTGVPTGYGIITEACNWVWLGPRGYGRAPLRANPIPYRFTTTLLLIIRFTIHNTFPRYRYHNNIPFSFLTVIYTTIFLNHYGNTIPYIFVHTIRYYYLERTFSFSFPDCQYTTRLLEVIGYFEPISIITYKLTYPVKSCILKEND